MIKFGFAVHDICCSAWRLYQATDRQQKLRNTEALIAGMLKAALSASVCFSLYIARFAIKTPSLQYVLAGATFCMHPLATLDVMGTVFCVDGLFHIFIAYIPHGKIKAELHKWGQAAENQVRADGFKFYSFWERRLSGVSFPPETKQRIIEVYKDIAAKQGLAQINAWGVPMSENWIGGTKLMKYAVSSGIGAIFANAIPASFWLDRKLIDLSKWLAPHLV
jgi:hypothetical protein